MIITVDVVVHYCLADVIYRTILCVLYRHRNFVYNLRYVLID